MAKKRTGPKPITTANIRDNSFTKKKKKINSYKRDDLIAFVAFLGNDCPNSKVHIAAKKRLAELV